MADVPLLKSPVPVSEIDATGTADATTFLRGDGTWAAPAGGGGGVESVWLPASAAIATSGSPALDVAGARAPAWRFDPAADEMVGWGVGVLPSTWPSLSGTLYWYSTAGTGNVVFDAFISDVAVGDAFNVTDLSATGVVSAALDANDLMSATLFSNQAVTMSQFTHLRLRRDADHASDTYAGDAYVLGVLLTPGA